MVVQSNPDDCVTLKAVVNIPLEMERHERWDTAKWSP